MKRNLMFKVLLMLMVGCFLSIDAFAQQMTVKGLVKDTTGEPIIGANVVVKGTTNGTITDFDGNFQLNANKGDIIVISFIGYQSQEVPAAPSLNILLKDDSQMLQDVVVIGYGTVKKNDATGSVTAIKAEEKNKGLTVSPQDMIAGKVAGVNVATSTGQPGGGSAIRIRGGSSLTASNDPLIVIDGVVMSSGSVEGLSNPLSSVNPTDIESFTVLKDASATAIYGSRASNGVIIITTKKGKTGSVKINYSGNVSVSTRKNKIDVMTGDEYRDFIINNPNATEAMITAVNLYPGVNTDWQDEVMRTAVSTEHNISAYGSVKDYLPYRVSFGYTNQNGILKTSNFERYTGSVSLTPKFFDDHLNMNLNAKGIYIKNQFADTGAVVGAVSFDPTKPVKNDNNKFGGYFTWTTDNDPNGTKASSAGVNPVSLLEMTDDQSKVKSFIGNAQFDYKVHFLPDLRLNLNVGMDYTKSDGDKYVDPSAPGSYGEDPLKSGSNYLYFYERRNTLLDFYAQYSKDFAKQHFDVMAGYSYQKYHYESNKETWYLSRNEENFGEKTSMNGDQQPAESQYVLLSFYGRLNYTAWDKYLLTFTLRDDASSRFAKNNRWGLFPSVALGWKISQEAFLRDSEVLSDLKLRLSYGQTGQQDILNDYPYMTTFTVSYPESCYQFGDKWYYTYRPNGYDSDIKWETTETYNIGLDYGFLNNRIYGSVDYYQRHTKDLLNTINVISGTNYSSVITTNIGEMDNKGVEFAINAVPIHTKNWKWTVGLNYTWNDSEITKLNVIDSDANFVQTGAISGTGKTVQVFMVGQRPYTFYLAKQAYDDNGKPIEGQYVQPDGSISATETKYATNKSALPTSYLGFNTQLTYKNWDFAISGHGAFGNYVYN